MLSSLIHFILNFYERKNELPIVRFLGKITTPMEHRHKGIIEFPVFPKLREFSTSKIWHFYFAFESI